MVDRGEITADWGIMHYIDFHFLLNSMYYKIYKIVRLDCETFMVFIGFVIFWIFFFSPFQMFMNMMGMGTSRPPLSRQRRDSGDACVTEIKKRGYESVRELYLAHKWVSITQVVCKNPGQSCSTNSCPTFGHECRSG